MLKRVEVSISWSSVAADAADAPKFSVASLIESTWPNLAEDQIADGYRHINTAVKDLWKKIREFAISVVKALGEMGQSMAVSDEYIAHATANFMTANADLCKLVCPAPWLPSLMKLPQKSF